jgi:N-acetylglucosaminyldiphosphoundecaprenol N-acetyl-beta-D-mannosaminyltransferase
MEKYFNVPFEFDHQKINDIIQQYIENNIPGYVCSVDLNNLISTNKNQVHLDALNNATANLCDSTWIPFFINRIYGTRYRNYAGADLFFEYVNMKKYRQFFLGSTPDVLDGLKIEMSKIDPTIKNMRFESLPFRKVEEFDYRQIATMINKDNPDIIWISLGAPKQEQFMGQLKPYLYRGMMLGVGAIFNFNCGQSSQKRAPRWVQKIKMEWLFRLIQEPKRLGKRALRTCPLFPGMIKEEIQKKLNKH